MANELEFIAQVPTATHYVHVYDPAQGGAARNVTDGQWDANEDGTWSKYTVAATRVGSTSRFRASLPSGTDADAMYDYQAFEQAGGSAADSDSPVYFATYIPGNVPANVVEIGGDAQSATDLKDFADAGYDPSTNKVQGVVLVDTTTTNSDMRGTDSAALATHWTSTRAGYVDKLNVSGALAHSDAANTYKADVSGLATSTALASLVTTVGVAGVGLTAVTAAALGAQAKLDVNAEADSALSDAGVTTTRTGYLDKLNVSGNVASQADVTAITQAQRVRIVVPGQIERPDSSSTDYRVWIYVYNEQHTAEDLDSNPTVAAENNAGTDRSSNLGTVTKPGGTTGQYYVDYTVADSHAIEAIVFKVDATEGAVTTQYSAATLVVDTTAVDFTSADRAKLDTLHDTRIPGVLTPSNIADQVWDEARSAHTAGGSFGEGVLVDEINPGGITSSSFGANSFTAAAIAADAGAEIADAVLDEALSGHTTAGTLGKAVADVLEDTGTTIPGLIGTAQNDLDLLTGADGAILATTQPNYAPAKAGDAMDLVPAPDSDAVDAIQDGLSTFDSTTDTVKLDATQAAYAPAKAGDAMTLTSAYDVYHADILLTVDEANTRDEYTITWFKNGVAVTSGITVPTLQVVKRADGTDLIASTTPTQIGSTGSYKHDESSGRITAGEATLVIAGATIDGSPRSFRLLVGRDSST